MSTPPIGNLSPAVVVAGRRPDRARSTSRTSGPVEIDWDGLSWARKRAAERDRGTGAEEASQMLTPRRCRLRLSPTAADTRSWRRSPRRRARSSPLDPNDGSVVGAGRRLRLLHQQVQPRDPGAAPARLRVQAVPVFRRRSRTASRPASVLPGCAHRDRRQRQRRTPGARRTPTREFNGPTRLREALVHSRNLVSIRVLKDHRHLRPPSTTCSRFGFDPRTLPHEPDPRAGHHARSPRWTSPPPTRSSPTAASASHPYFIDRIEDASGKVVWRAAPACACLQCERRARTRRRPHQGAAAARRPQRDAIRSCGSRHRCAPAELAPRVISRAERLHHGRHDGGCDQARHGAARAGPQPHRHRRQDRHDQRGARHLVQRLQHATSWPRCGWASTRSARSAKPRRARARRCRSGSASCARRCKGVPEQRRTMPDGLVSLRISPETGTLVSAENSGRHPGTVHGGSPAQRHRTPPTAAQGRSSRQASGEPIF